jgi:hypothetical protein
MPFDENLDKMLQPVTRGDFLVLVATVNNLDKSMRDYVARTSQRFERMDRRFERIEKVLTKICAKLEIPEEKEEEEPVY